ncbi:hypothetical protein [Teichococcus wenyumeiae]|uniref:hypothetical protein n=1 Tax=Teichococcus wenyumeiae TaxID=2478470 RepID=UPI00131454F4|nr:hypothetical protein [Pseudoroseomonas wenyumeiae]
MKSLESARKAAFDSCDRLIGFSTKPFAAIAAEAGITLAWAYPGQELRPKLPASGGGVTLASVVPPSDGTNAGDSTHQWWVLSRGGDTNMFQP